MKPLPFALAPLALALSAPSLAANTTELDEVVITASRSAQTTGVNTAYIDVISEEDIKASGAQTVLDALRRSAIIQVVDSSGSGSSPTIGMRGFGSNGSQNTLILIDGRRLNNETDIGTVNLRNLSINNVARIEIVNGSAGALYGAGAVGGIINIITKRANGNQLDLSISRGSYDTEKYRARASAQKDAWSVVVVGDKELSDGYRDNNDLNSAFGQARIAYDGKRFSSYLEASKLDHNTRLPGGLSANEVAANRRQSRLSQANHFIDLDAERLSIGGSIAINENWSFDLDTSLRKDKFDNFILGAFNQSRNQVSVSPKLQGSLDFLGKSHKVITGLDIENGNYNISSAFGTTKGKPTTQSSYIQVDTALNKSLNMITGYRYGRTKNTIDNTPAIPKFKDSVGAGSVGFFWAATSNRTLWLRADQNFRFAAIDEHTSSFPFGNTLKTQTGESFEAGIEQRIGKHKVSFQGYQLDLKNEIGFSPVAGFFCCNINLDKTRRRGATVNLTSELSDVIQANIQASLIDAKFTNGAFKGNQVPHVAKAAITANLRYKYSENTSLAFESQYTGKQTIDADFDSDQPKAKAVFVNNLAATHKWQKLSLSIRMNNLFNQKYNLYSVEEVVGFDPDTFEVTETSPAYYPAAERNFLVTLAYQLK